MDERRSRHPAEDQASGAAWPASLALVRYASGGEDVYARMFTAAGAGPHPTLLLLHGFPGTELNFDLAHAARRHGWNILLPHYRGTWGSPGSFSWANAIEDATAAFRWIGSNETRARFRVRPDAAAVAGHSIGGFAALHLAASVDGVLGAAAIAGFNLGAFSASVGGDDGVARAAAFWADGAAVVAGTSGLELAREASARGSAWDLTTLAGTLSTKRLLLVGASRDAIAEPATHHLPLEAALRSAGATSLTSVVLDSDHVFSELRVELAETLTDWLAGLGEGA